MASVVHSFDVFCLLFLAALGIVYAAICLPDIIYVQEPPHSLCHDSFSSVRCEPGKMTFMLQVSPVLELALSLVHNAKRSA